MRLAYQRYYIALGTVTDHVQARQRELQYSDRPQILLRTTLETWEIRGYPLN
jgi:hypothetical protein